MQSTEFENPTPISKSSDQRIFPLHLTPFESYMVTDDRPDYPMTFIVQFEFSGSLEPNAFKASIDDALERHPLLRSVIRPAKLNRDCWVDSGKVRPLVHFGTLGEKIEFPGAGIEYIDLRNEPGLRIWVRSDDTRVVLTTQFHHAVCDGIGSYQFLGDVLSSYAKRTGVDEIKDAPQLAHPRNRGHASYDLKNFLTDKGRPQNELKQAVQVAFGRNSTLESSRARHKTATKPYAFPGILSFEFDKNEHRQLRHAAQSRGQMVNDLLLEKLFETLHGWTRRTRAWLGRGKICVMMPLDLREPDLEIMSACNIVTYAFIRRSRKLLKQPEKLKESLGKETLLLKHQRHQTKFMNLVVGSLRYPRLLKAALFRDHCMATTILSNTGDPTKRFFVDLPRENGMIRCGNLLLTEISGVPPMRIKTRATISIFTYRRVLKICIRCDPHFLDLDDTQLLLDQYVDRIKKTMD